MRKTGPGVRRPFSVAWTTCLVATLGMAACASEKKADVLASETIGPEGGEIAGGGATLVIPAGALTAETEIQILRSNRNLSARDFEQEGEALAFAPDGLVLRLPGELTFGKVPAEPAILFEQDELTVAALGSRAFINELGIASVAVAGEPTVSLDDPKVASTPGGVGDTPLHTDRATLTFAVAAIDTPSLVMVLTAYDDGDAYDKPLNGDGQGDCAFQLENIVGGSLALGCSGAPTSATVSTSAAEIQVDAVPFQAGKIETPVTVGIVAGGHDLAYQIGFLRFNTGPCFNETCSGHGTCVEDGGGTCQCEDGYAPEGLDCVCIPVCDGRECGGDSCGGQCPPGCNDGEMCDDGQCVPDGSTTSGGGTSTTGGGSTSGGGSSTSGGGGSTSGGGGSTSGGGGSTSGGGGSTSGGSTT